MNSKQMTEMFADLVRPNQEFPESIDPNKMYNVRALFTVVEAAIDLALEKAQNPPRGEKGKTND